MPSLSFIIHKRIKILYPVVVIRINENKWQPLLLILYCYYLIFTSSEIFEVKREGIIWNGNWERDLQGTIFVGEGREQPLELKQKTKKNKKQECTQ